MNPKLSSNPAPMIHTKEPFEKFTAVHSCLSINCILLLDLDADSAHHDTADGASVDVTKEKLRSARPASTGLGMLATFCAMSEGVCLPRRAMWSRCSRHGGLMFLLVIL
eukprot:scaffold612_cov138-Skeletonema_menzelii.AAC.4